MRPLQIPPRALRAAALTICAALAFATAQRLPAQGIGTDAIAVPGSAVDRAIRLRQLQGLDSTSTLMSRATGSGIAALRAGRDTLVVLLPEFATSYHSAHPWSGNDGLLRQGRGRNAQLSAGLAARWGPFTAVILPQYAEEANLAFQVRQYPQPVVDPARNLWANPFYRPGNTMDYPQRFGDRPRAVLRPQGRIAYEPGLGIRIGVGSETRWWGPGLQNALLLSSNAPAIEQIFLESAAPIQTPLGQFGYTYLLGRLNESEFFDFKSENDQRSLSAASLNWTPPPSWSLLPDLSLSRAVMARQSPGMATALDFARNVGRPWSRPADTLSQREQITTVAALWRVPEAGVEAWVEWARYELPGTFREYLEQPGHAQGYTLGFQWAKPVSLGLLHIATEFSYAEPSPSIRTRPIKTSYVGTSVEQGWTHEGQMLGPWIGPAASSQWAMADLYRGPWRVGGTLGRLRRDAEFRFIEPFPLKREDIQMYASLRVGRTLWGWDALLEYTDAVRLNHLFQAFPIPGTSGNDTEGVDLINRSLLFTISPHLSPRRR